MKEKIRKFIYDILKDSLYMASQDVKNQQLKHTADLARLVVDAKNSKLSFQSRDFLMRMNIHPKEFDNNQNI